MKNIFGILSNENRKKFIQILFYSTKSVFFLLILNCSSPCKTQTIAVTERTIAKNETGFVIPQDSIINLQIHNNKESACLSAITASLQKKLIESMGQDKYNEFALNDGKININISIDSLGVIRKLNHYKIISISEKDFRAYFDKISREILFCLFSTDSNLSYLDYIKYGKNNFGFTLQIK